jgi:hypothetical protein
MIWFEKHAVPRAGSALATGAEQGSPAASGPQLGAAARGSEGATFAAVDAGGTLDSPPHAQIVATTTPRAEARFMERQPKVLARAAPWSFVDLHCARSKNIASPPK